jgi:hypothetical protein
MSIEKSTSKRVRQRGTRKNETKERIGKTKYAKYVNRELCVVRRVRFRRYSVYILLLKFNLKYD